MKVISLLLVIAAVAIAIMGITDWITEAQETASSGEIHSNVVSDFQSILDGNLLSDSTACPDLEENVRQAMETRVDLGITLCGSEPYKKGIKLTVDGAKITKLGRTASTTEFSTSTLFDDYEDQCAAVYRLVQKSCPSLFPSIDQEGHKLLINAK